MVAFEAAVAGGIPIIKALREGLTANRIEWIAGIINGTTNFILSRDARQGAGLRHRAEGGAAPGLCRGRPDLRHRGHRRRAQGDDHERDRVRHPGAVRQGARRGHHRRCRRPTSAMPSSSATASSCWASRAARDARHRAARAPDAGAGQAPDRQRRRRDERGGGAGRRGRHHAVLRQGRGRRADGLAPWSPTWSTSRGCTPPTPTTACRTWRSSPTRWPTRRSCRSSEVVTAFYLRLRVADQAGVLARITGILAEHDISIDAVLQREAAEGETQTDLIILTHDTVEGRMNAGDGADAGAADRAGADRAHPQGRAELMTYLSTRGDADRRAASATSCSKAWRPTAACTCPSATRRSTRPRWRAGAACRTPSSRSRSCRSTSTTSRPPTCSALVRARPTPPRSSARDEIVPLQRARGRACASQALSNGPTLAFKDMAMQLLGNLFEYELGAPRRDAQHPRRDLGRHRQRGRVRDARQAAACASSCCRPHGRMSPFQQAQMFSLQDANIHNIAIEGVFDDCQDIVKAVSQRPRVQAPATSIGTVNSINWARLLAQVVYYFAGYFQATRGNDERVSFAVPSGNFGNVCAGHVARMMGLPIERLVRRDQRERRARRVLPHRRLPRARQRPRRTRRRARRWTSARPRTSSASSSTCWAATPRARASCSASASRATAASTLDAATHSRASRASASSRAAARTPTAWRRSATPGERFGTLIDPHTADGLKVAREHRRPGRADDRARDRAAGQVRRDHRRGARHAAAAAGGAGGLEDRPRRCTVLPADAERVKSFIAAHDAA